MELNFDIFKKVITNINKNDLLGNLAHEKMLPMDRIKNVDFLKKNIELAKKAAVMVLFVPKNNIPYLILIKRNEYAGVHSAQMAFPGGKPEPNDLDLKQTALRETKEEIGIYEKDIVVLHNLTNVYIQPSNFLVTPFLGHLNKEYIYKINTKEVQEVFEISIKELLDDNNIVKHKVQTSYSDKKIEVPSFFLKNEIVWGATAMILSELKEILKTKF